MDLDSSFDFFLKNDQHLLVWRTSTEKIIYDFLKLNDYPQFFSESNQIILAKFTKDYPETFPWRNFEL